jgi:tRNA threonylcarbamoyladenosine biosynthesis protein TsaE
MVEHGIVRIDVHDVEETRHVGEVLGGLLPPGSVLLLTGDLGAGKTQLTKGVARGMHIEDEITSPTFNICLVHDAGAGDGRCLQHFDLYRLEDEAELDDIDYFGMLEHDDAVSVVEWGDKFPQALPEDYLAIELSAEGDGQSRGMRIWASGDKSVSTLSNFMTALAIGERDE